MDKTGTITESTMQADDPLPLAENAPVSEILAAFYAGEQPDNDTGRALTARFGQGSTPWLAVRSIPFNTAYKYSAKDFGAHGCYVVGAPDVLAGSRAAEFADVLSPLLAQGRRVLLLAQYNTALPNPPAALDAAQLEFLALLPVQNRIRENAPKTFRHFAKQGVAVKVISGDDPQAVSHVAANAGIAGAERWVDAATLRSEKALAEAAETCTVFGRVTPEQKRQLVHALQRRGHTVAMTGDGVNDVLALKDADCGIAMASGAQAASQVAQLVLLDSDFAALPGVVAEGRRVINNIQRSASLFLVKNIFSFLLSIVALALPLAYPFQPLQLSLVTFATIGAPAFFLALEPNHELVRGRFLRNVLRAALPGGMTDFLLVFCVQGFGHAFDIPSEMVGTICTFVILCVGLQVLWGVCIPFTPLHWGIWGTMTVVGVGGAVLLARWLPLVRLDLGGTLVLVVMLALSAPTLAGLTFMGERLQSMANDWKNRKKSVRRHKKSIRTTMRMDFLVKWDECSVWRLPGNGYAVGAGLCSARRLPATGICRESTLFLQLGFQLGQILADEHKAEADHQQRTGKPDGFCPEQGDALRADACTQGKNEDDGKVMQGLPQQLFIAGMPERDQRVHAAAQIADAHGAGKGVAVHLAERLHLHGAGEGYQRIGGHIPFGREKAHRKQHGNLGQQYQLPPVHALGLPPAQADALRRRYAQRKGKHWHKIVAEPRQIALKQALAHQHDVAGLRIGKYLAAPDVGIGVLQPARCRQKHNRAERNASDIWPR